MPSASGTNTWQDYVEITVQTGHVGKFAVHGLLGDKWASSLGFQVTKAEIASLVRAFIDPSQLHKYGIKLNGVTYVTLKVDKDLILGKKGSTGCAISKCKQCVAIGVYDEGMHPGGCTSIIMKLGDYLREAGI
ncbi:profilin-1A-like [Lingula anatina]|uniref:Profilin n=1 Tax=Lingula anatina TaxID=7574 RepID=A0A1S3IK78_LINAN|nr:profilin-1A-like [Lingula anatina]|eukprot:XP_013397924.1 profilin-1A-like [Lingula anatina]